MILESQNKIESVTECNDHSILQRPFIRQCGLKALWEDYTDVLKTANNSNKCLNSHISKCERVKFNHGHIFCERTWGYYE